MIYRDRIHAGEILSELLLDYQNGKDVIVLGMARGGMPIAEVIAQKINAPLDVMIIRKIGMPGHKEYAIGAIASGQIAVFNQEIIQRLNISANDVQNIVNEEKAELLRRELEYRDHHSFPDIQQKTVILVDDGIATGFSLKAAIAALQIKRPKEIIIAVPVASQESIEELESLCFRVLCPLKPDQFRSVGEWYFNFSQVSDDEVISCLKKHKTAHKLEGSKKVI